MKNCKRCNKPIPDLDIQYCNMCSNMVKIIDGEMRPPERIDIFLENIDWDFLSERWDIKIDEDLQKKILSEDNIKDWKAFPDLRFGQLLINNGIIPDTFNIWYDEDDEILRKQGVDLREFVFWGLNYDEDENLLPKTKYRLIKNLDTKHIRKILIMFERTQQLRNKDLIYVTALQEELNIRKDEKSKEERNLFE